MKANKVSRTFTVTTVMDGVTYYIQTDVANASIASNQDTTSLSFSCNAFRREGEVDAAYSCYWVLFGKSGSTYTYLNRSTSKSTSFNVVNQTVGRTGVASDALVIRIGDTLFPTDNTSPSQSYLAEIEILVVAQGKPGDPGSPGASGKWYDYAGIWGTDTTSVTNTANIGYYVLYYYSGSNKHFYMNTKADGVANTTAPANSSGTANTGWEQIADDRNYYIAKAYFGDYAELGSGIINGDWMISKYGVIYDSTNTAASNPHLIDDTHTWTDNTSGSRSTTYSVYGDGSSVAAFTLFDTAYPNSSHLGVNNFCPMYALNMKTGKIYMNDAYLKGEIIATSGTIGGFTIPDNAPYKLVSDGVEVRSATDTNPGIELYTLDTQTLSNKEEIVSITPNSIELTHPRSGYDPIKTVLSNGELEIFYSGAQGSNIRSVSLAPASLEFFSQAGITTISQGTAGFALAGSGGTSINGGVISTSELTYDIDGLGNIFKLYLTDETNSKVELSSSTFPVQIKATNANNNTSYFKTEGDKATMYGDLLARIESSYSITCNRAIVPDSDERLKDIEKEASAPIEKIAEARVVDFSYKSDITKTKWLGSIAQDWQKIYPNAVKENGEGFLGLDYGAIGVAIGVEAAKEIVALKQENEMLKQRLAAIEAKLGINN